MTDHQTRPLRPGIADPPSAASPLAVGACIESWRIERVLATGGFGTVYAVRHDQTGEAAALKLLHARLAASSEVLARFDREIQIVRELRHPSIVRLIDAGFSDEGRPYMCLELLEGEELGAWIARERVPPPRAVEILASLCDALIEAHTRGIVHRDIKASNVMLCRPPPGRELGRVVLLDFGIAKLASALAPELTASNQALGTPTSMAPEQILNNPIDGRTDVYALGSLLFHMVTGHPPFEDPSAMMIQYLHLHARRPLASKVDGVPAQLDAVITRAMAIDPAERFPDVQALLAAARAAVLDRPQSREVLVEDAVAILVTVTNRGGAQLDEALVHDLEAVLPLAERTLTHQGFTLAIDLGTSAVFVARRAVIADPVAAAKTTWRALQARSRRDPRVAVSLGVHEDRAPFAGNEIQPCALLRPATWPRADAIEGVWVDDRRIE